MTAFLVCSLLAQSPLSFAATKKTWPTRPINLVVPFPPGGGNDTVGRLLAEKLSRELGQAVFVSNRPGANGSIAANAVAHAAPDGYTLILTSIGTHAINPLVNSHIRYDPRRDFTHISIVARTGNVLLASPSFSGKTVLDVEAQSRDKPLNFAITGYGSSNHAAMALFKQAARLNLNEILYKGDAVALNDMVGGHVQLMFVNYLAALPHIKAHRLHALAVTAPFRSKLLPNVPTMQEAGFNVVVEAWIGLAGPAKLPGVIVDRLNASINKVLLNQEIQERLALGGVSTMVSTPQEAATFIAREGEKWSRVVKAAKIVAE